jgi:hypothetical protein
MSDQGYGQGGYGQQPPYDPGQPPQFPQSPAPQPYDPNQTAQFPQSPAPPPYDPNQTAQLPQYPQQPYDPNQTAAYGQPMYPDYSQPPPYGGGPGGPPQYPGAPPADGGSGGRRGLLIASIVAVLAALGVGAFFLFSGSDSASAATPADAAKALFEAGKTSDVDAAKKVLCQSDLAAGVADQLKSSGRITQYQVLGTNQQGANRATVTVRFSSTQSRSQTLPVPVIKEDGSWKVCYTAQGSGPPPGNPTDFPSVSIPPISIPPITDLPTGIPTDLPTGIPENPCSFIDDPETVALAYVGAAEIGQTDVAQSCVFEDSVPRELTASLATDGSGLFAPSGSSGSTYEFDSIDNTTHLSVTVTKEGDGTYYITDVVKS